MGAGGLREPRRIRNPGRGSQRPCRALGGTRILLAAAPTAPPCFYRWQRSSLLRRGFFPRRTVRRVLRVALAAFFAAPWQGFEKAERCPSLASLFPPQAAVGSAAVRIHPPSPREGYYKTETPVPDLDTGVLGGRGWIRTTEAESSRFTVCPHWPLGNTPIFFLQSRGLPVYVTTESVICQPIIWFGCKKYIAITKALPCGLALQRPGGRALQPDYSNSTF